MAFRPMTAKDTGNSVSAADWKQIGDNFTAGVPDAMTTKGDMLVGTGPDTGIRVAAGTNDAYLWASSASTPGVVWSITARAGATSTTSTGATPVNTHVKAVFNGEDFDTAAAFATSRFTAPHPGYYLVTFMGLWDDSTSAGGGDTTMFTNDMCVFKIYKGGAIYSVVHCTVAQSGWSSIETLPYFGGNGMDIVYLDTGNYIEIYGWQNGIAALFMNGLQDADRFWFQVAPLI
jgi:hypothetical protein